VALASDYNSTWEGPGNENTIATLANSSLLCVMRMKFDTNYMTTRSDDQGLSWTKAVEMSDASGLGMGCCRPRLLILSGGGGAQSLLLSGGRCTAHRAAENHVWRKTIDGGGTESGWERHSLSYWHNELAPAGMPVYTESVNCTKGGVKQAKCSDDETLGYTR
jgi:hypothetical protein